MPKFEFKGFLRDEFVTPGTDPTAVVRWTAHEGTSELKIEEFFGDVYTTVDGQRVAPVLQALGKAFFDLAEEAWDRHLDSFAEDTYVEVEAAERAAGWDPNP